MLHLCIDVKLGLRVFLDIVNFGTGLDFGGVVDDGGMWGRC